MSAPGVHCLCICFSCSDSCLVSFLLYLELVLLTKFSLAPLDHSRYAVIAFGCASCPKLTCGREGCGTEFCYHCKQIWHPNQTCDAARQERAQSLRLRTIRSSSISYSQESGAAGIYWAAVSVKHLCTFAQLTLDKERTEY